MTKTFRVWHKTGKPENIQSDTMSFKRTATGLTVRFSGNRKVEGAVCVTEVPKDEKPRR